MMPVGPMMVEHRLIERMVALMGKEGRRIRSTGQVNTDFVLSAVDFIRTYADRCHHGKEEDILFRDLKKKPLSLEHRDLLAELETEHRMGRETVHRLVAARERFLRGDRAAASELATQMDSLAAFYPKHIEKEDKHFFEPCMAYFSAEELDRMLEECMEFDRRLVHGVYGDLVGSLEGNLEGNLKPGPQVGALVDETPGIKHTCMLCGYTYDPRQGDPVGRVPPGVPFLDLPEGWCCPRCHASKKAFIPAKG